MTKFLESHPAISLIITGGHVMLGKMIPGLSDFHLPPILIECLQAGAYTISIIVGGITIYGFIKKFFKKNRLNGS